MKTTIIETEQETQKIDLGTEQANAAYEQLDQMRETYTAMGNKAFGIAMKLREKGPGVITPADKETLEPILRQAEEAKTEFVRAEQILTERLDQMAAECEALRGETVQFERFIKDHEDAMRLVDSLSQEVYMFRQQKKTREAVEKIYLAREALGYLVLEAKRNWVEHTCNRAMLLVEEVQ